jgi:tight adherence protein B
VDVIFLGFAVLLFAACILLVEGAWLWWSGNHGRAAQRVARRLQLMTKGRGVSERISILKQRRYSKSPKLERWLRRMPAVAAVDRLLLQSGKSWSVAQFLGWSALLAVPGLILPQIWNMPSVARMAFFLLALGTPYLVLLRARSARLRLIEQQLPEAADFLARALRAGHSFSNVLQMVGDELPAPIGGEFKMTYEEINYGVRMEEALHNLGVRIPLPDLRYLVVAVLVQRESGGNLAEIFQSVSGIIRARLKLLAQVRVMSAEGRLSAWVLGLLPLAVLLIMSVVNPRYASVLWTDPAGIKLLWYAAGMIVVGLVWMRSMIRIRV